MAGGGGCGGILSQYLSHGEQKLLGLHRLLEKANRSQANRKGLICLRNVGCGNENDRDVLGFWVAPDFVSKRKPIELRHQDVGENERRLFDGDDAERFIPIVCCDDGVALVLERHFHELKQVRNIFDNENRAVIHT